MNTSKKILAVVVGLGLAAFAQNASAQAAVAVVNCIPTSGAMGYGCATEATLAAQFTYLTTGRNTTASGMAGSAAGMNDGVIENMRKQNDEQALGVEGARQNMPNEDLAARQRDYSLKQREAIDRNYAPMSAAACRDATMSGGGLGGGASAGGGGAGAGGGAQSPGGRERDVIQDEERRILTPKTADTMLTELVAGDNNKYCTAADALNKVPGCAGAGPLAGANLRFRTLIQPAMQDMNKSNYSISANPSDAARRAALAYIALHAARPAPAISDAAKNGPAGKKYLVLQRRYNARALATSNFYAHSLGLSTALDANNPYVSQVWNHQDFASEYTKIYPGRARPQAPSQRELMHFFVDRQFSGKVAEEDLAKKEDPNHLAARNLEMQKINAYLILKLYEQMEYNGMVSTAQLAQQVDPVSRVEMERMAGDVNR